MSKGHQRVRERYDWSRTTPSTAVVETVAEAAESDPRELEILARSMDPDALDRLVQGSSRENPGVQVTFRYDGHEVVVHGDGELEVSPTEG